GPPDLLDGFENVAGGVNPALRQLAAVGVHRMVPDVADPGATLHVGPGLPGRHQSELLHPLQGEEAEAVVQHPDVHVLWAEAGGGVHLAAPTVQAVTTLGAEVGDVVPLPRPGPGPQHRRRPGAVGRLGPGHQVGVGAVDRVVAVEQVDRLGDPPAGRVLLDGQRLLHDGVGVHQGVLALGDAQPADLVVGDAEPVHPPPLHEPDPLHRVPQAVGDLELVVPADAAGLGVDGWGVHRGHRVHHLADDGDVAVAGVDHLGGPGQRPDPEAPFDGPADVAHAEAGHDGPGVRRRVMVHLDVDAVDGGRIDAGVVGGGPAGGD